MALSKIKTGSIADDAVTSTKIATGGIATLDMADGSVTSLKIADGAIGTADISDSAITTIKLNDGSTTPAKLSTGGITWSTSGNVGVNTVASNLSWATGNNVLALGSSNAVAWSSNQFNTRIGNNLYHDGTNYKFTGSSWANFYSLNDGIGSHTWYSSTASGSANANATLNSMMRLTKDAYLGIGGNITPTYPLEVAFGTPTGGSQVSDIAYFRPWSSQGGYGATGSRVLLGAALNNNIVAPISAISSYLQDGNSTGGGGLTIWTKTAGDSSLIRRVNIDQGGQVGIGLEPGGAGLLEIGVAKNATALALTQNPSVTNSYNDEIRLDFRMNNEVSPTPQYTGNPAVRVASYLERSGNGYGLKVYTRTGGGTGEIINNTRFAADGDLYVYRDVISRNVLGRSYYSYSNSSAATSFSISNINVYGNRDQGAVFDVTISYRAFQAASNWGIIHGRFAVDYADQNGRTYSPLYTTANFSNTGYGRNCTGFYFTKPDPYNSLGTFTISFNVSASIEFNMVVQPIVLTSNSGAVVF